LRHIGIAALSHGPDEVVPSPAAVSRLDEARKEQEPTPDFMSCVGTKPQQFPWEPVRRPAAPVKAVLELFDDVSIQAPPELLSDDVPEPPRRRAPFSFDVNVNPNDQGLGLKLFVMPSNVSISRISPGAIDTYNRSHPNDAVQINDFVQAVNGKTTIHEMTDGLKSRGALTLRLYRPMPISINIRKNGGPAGCKVHALPSHSVVHIQELLEEGAFMKHNAQSPPEAQIKAHDCIISINGVSGDAEIMAQKLADPNISEFELVVVRPPLPAIAA